MFRIMEDYVLIAGDLLVFRRQQLDQSVYCEPDSRRANNIEDDRRDVQSKSEKVKVYDTLIIRSHLFKLSCCRWFAIEDEHSYGGKRMERS
jgi:hypothetical protein